MLAAERVWPWVTTAGMVTPMGPSPMSSAKWLTISATTFATLAGVDFAGVSIRSRSLANSPEPRSTGAPLMPLPPMSMPRTERPWAPAAGDSVMAGSLSTGCVSPTPRPEPMGLGDTGRHELRHRVRHPYGRRPRRRDLRPAGHASPAQRDRRLRQRPRGAGPDTRAAVGRRQVRDADADRAAVQDLERGGGVRRADPDRLAALRRPRLALPAGSGRRAAHPGDRAVRHHRIAGAGVPHRDQSQAEQREVDQRDAGPTAAVGARPS